MGTDMPQGSSAPGWNAARTDRRQILGGALVLGALAGTPLAVWNRVRAGEEGGATMAQKRLLERLSDLVIPATDTPGALGAGVPAFVELALLHGLEDTVPETAGHVHMEAGKGGLPVLDEAGRDLSRRAGGHFTSLPAARQFDALAAYDAAAFAPDQAAHPWRKIKTLILTGYYTSEIGGAKELQYELVPGRFDTDLPIPADNRSWSSDWTAVDFG